MPDFLLALRSSDPTGLVLRNQRTGELIATEILPALDSQTRRTGLLKHSALAAGVAMIIAPTNAIHTFFMKFPIDVAFVRRSGEIVKLRPDMRAWRMSAAWSGFAVVEMAAGSFARARTRRGDLLTVERGD